MTAGPGKAPKKEKRKTQSAEERLQAMRYNHMMYGPTAGEPRASAKRADYGAAYLKHPKFQELMTAFRKGLAFQFEVKDKDRPFVIATAESQITFNGRVLCYSRSLNRYEDSLLLDRVVATQFQTIEALVHLVFAILRSLPELEAPPLAYTRRQFYLGAEPLEEGVAVQGPNLLLGSYRHQRAEDRVRK